MEKNIYTVAKLNEEIKLLLEGDFIFSGIMVQGEIVSLNKHYTGHYYFKLRDKDGSMLSCIMFSSNTKNAYEDLKDGDEVICTGSISVYEKGGTYSLNVRKIVQNGLGKYLRDLKKLENKLLNEGYFSLEKKAIPYFPGKIAILTSLKGAAICDVTSTIQKRCRTGIYIFPCMVQGENAPKTIIEALDEAKTINPDVIILTRGGGSKDDLFAFNDEELVKKIATFEVPIITAVGHSIDSSLVDKVSSLCCITPTDAGNAVILQKEDYLSRIKNATDKIEKIIQYKLENFETKLIHLSRLIENNSLTRKKELLLNNVISLKEKTDVIIKVILEKKHNDLTNLSNSLYNCIYLNLKNKVFDYRLLNEKLSNFNPLVFFEKGYSLVYNKNEDLINSINKINIDDEINLKLSDGIIKAKVIDKENVKWKK